MFFRLYARVNGYAGKKVQEVLGEVSCEIS